MSTASEISVGRVPLPTEGAGDGAAALGSAVAWSPVAARSNRRPSPSTLGGLAVLAGIAAMALGGLAVLSAARSDESGLPQATAPAPPTQAPGSAAERRALALLAKPSTDRVVFRGSGGRLVLAVGSGGRAALLMRGLERAPTGQPYRAWVVGPQRVVRAAQFTGGERAVLLSVPVGRGATVVVATDRRAALRPGTGRLVAPRS